MIKEDEEIYRPCRDPNRKFSELSKSKPVCKLNKFKLEPQEGLPREPQSQKAQEYERLNGENYRNISFEKQKSIEEEKFERSRYHHPQENLDPRHMKYSNINYQQK